MHCRRRTQVLAAIVVAALTAMDRSATSSTAQPFSPNYLPPSSVPPRSSSNLQTQSPTTVVEPGYLGVIADENAQGNGGIRLMDVVAGGPAQAAGLRPGDVITSIDGQTANTVDDMANLMAGRPAGDEVTFVVRRGNEVSRIEVRLTKRPPPEQRRFGTFGRLTPNGAAPPSSTLSSSTGAYTGAPAVPSSIPPYASSNSTEPLPVPSSPPANTFGANSPLVGVPESKALLGVRAVPIVPELQRSLNLPEARGALIVEVQPGSPAQKAGLPLEAAVVGIDGMPINSPQELAEAVSERGAGTDVRLSYFRFGQLTEKMIRLGVGPSPAGVNPPVAQAPTTVGPVTPRNTLPPAPSVLPTTPTIPLAPPPAVLPPSKDDKPAVSAPAETEADKLRRQIREMEARLADLEKQKSTKPTDPKPPTKKP